MEEKENTDTVVYGWFIVLNSDTFVSYQLNTKTLVQLFSSYNPSFSSYVHVYALSYIFLSIPAIWSFEISMF